MCEQRISYRRMLRDAAALTVPAPVTGQPNITQPVNRRSADTTAQSIRRTAAVQLRPMPRTDFAHNECRPNHRPGGGNHLLELYQLDNDVIYCNLHEYDVNDPTNRPIGLHFSGQNLLW